MKVVVFGSRSWTDAAKIEAKLRELPAGSTIVHGACPGGGADWIAHKAAYPLGLTVIPVPISAEDREKAVSSRQAPIIRTIRMFDEHPDAELAIGFWDGKSPGSAFTRDEACRRGIMVGLVAP